MSDIQESIVEAARFAVIQRIIPAIRHGIVGKLHPIALMSDVLERRMKSPTPDLLGIQESLGQIKSLSRTAMHSCASLLVWIAPDEDATVPLNQGVDECLELLGTDFGMRGFVFQSLTGEIKADVSRAALRTLITASLLASVDTALTPSDLIIAAETLADQVVVSIRIRAADRFAIASNSGNYRGLRWSDVEALALAEKVKMSRQSDCIILHFQVAKH